MVANAYLMGAAFVLALGLTACGAFVRVRKVTVADTKYRQFAFLIATRFCCTLAGQMRAVVIGWQVYRLTHSPLALGLIGLAEAGPALGLALYAGHFVDTHAPKKVLRSVIAVDAMATLGLATVFLYAPYAAAQTGLSLRITALFFVSMLGGAARAFWSPCIYALAPTLIPRARLAQSAAWMGGTHQVAQALGPAAGGLAMAYLSDVSTLGLMTALLLAGIWLSLHLGPSDEEIHLAAHRRKKGELTRGLRYVLSNQVLFGAMTLDMVSVLFGGVTALLPVFAEQVLMSGPETLGFLRAAPALGATLANLILTQVDIRAYAGRWLLAAVWGFGCAILLFGASKDASVAFCALMFSGLCDGVSMVIRSLIIQLGSPPAMRGRISAVNSMFVGSANEIGQLESGLAASCLGLLPSIWLGGAVCLFTVIAAGTKFPQLRQLNLHRLTGEEKQQAPDDEKRGSFESVGSV